MSRIWPTTLRKMPVSLGGKLFLNFNRFTLPDASTSVTTKTPLSMACSSVRKNGAMIFGNKTGKYVRLRQTCFFPIRQSCRNETTEFMVLPSTFECFMEANKSCQMRSTHPAFSATDDLFLSFHF